MHRVSHWFMVGCLLCLIPRFKAFFFPTMPELGELTPSNPTILINQTLELNCTLFANSELNNSLLTFDLPLDKEASPDMLTKVGDKTLLLRKTISSVDDEGNYICRRVDEEDVFKGMVGSTSLVVEYEDVRNVTNFQCILDNTSNPQVFRCNWELGKYNHPAYIEISIILSVDNGQNTVECPQKNIKEECIWTEQDEPNINSMSKIVILNITNKEFKASKIFRKEFWTQNIMKPARPSFINASTSEPCGCASIAWATIPGGVNTTSSVTLMSQWNTVPLAYIVNTNSSLDVCNLVPATNYTVDIKIKPVEGMYYSDRTQIDFETCHTAPSSAPFIEASGYSSGECVYEERSVVVYWERIRPKFQNGPLIEYRVYVNGAEVGKRSPQEVSFSFNIPCEGQHNVSVRGCNQQGCSPKASILVPSYKDVLDLEKVVMEQLGSEVYLTWFGIENEAMTAVDIAWCKMKPAGFKCKDEIHVLRIRENANNIVLNQNIIGQDIDDYLFGVAAIDSRNISSGITWQNECRYVKNAVPPTVQHVSLLPFPPKNSLTVSWAPINCDSGTNNAYIHHYQIIYCQQPTADACGNSAVSAVNVSAWGVTQHTLTDLTPNVEYGIMVRAISLTMEGPNSEMITGRPNSNDLSKGQVAGIVIGSIFVAIFVAAGCFCVIRQVRRTLHINEKFEIETPAVVPYMNMTHGVVQRYHSLVLPSDRSSTPLITANGTTCNGAARQNSSVESIYTEPNVIEHEGEQRCVVSNPSKSNGVALALEDVPRQISKDSGHGSMSPTSVNQPTTPDKSVLENSRVLKELISNTENIPHGYAKATTIDTHCFHGNESLDMAEENPPIDSKELSSQCTDMSGCVNCSLRNDTSQQSTNTSQESHQVHSQHPKPGTVELTLGYVFYQADNPKKPFHQTSIGGGQFNETQLFTVDHSVNPLQSPLVDQPVNTQSERYKVNTQPMTENLETLALKTGETISSPKQPNGDPNFPDYIQDDPQIPDYLTNKTLDQTEMDYVPNKAEDDFVMDNVPNGTVKNSVVDLISNGPVDQIDQEYVSNDFEDILVMGYVRNGTDGQSASVARFVNDVNSNRTVNQPNEKTKCPSVKMDQSLTLKVPNDSNSSSVVDSVSSRPIDLSVQGYATEETEVESEKLDISSNCEKDMSKISVCDSGVDRKRNPEFVTESDTSSGSSASRSCINNSGYVTADMINSAGFVSTDVVEQESSAEEEESEEVVFNSGYVSVEAVMAI